MCGFVGFLDSHSRDEKNNIIKQMNSKIIHRGPNGEGFFTDEKFAVGSRRLSIVDLDGGGQPIFNENKNLLICFNGEIYNYKEIKAELINKGHVFSTSTDTEVILHGYEEYGENITTKLRGMFSFVIYNKDTHDLFGARDPYGTKPFYYYLDKNEKIFMFGSEIKSFLPHPQFKKELNKTALKMYLIFQYSVLEETFFKNVFKLPNGFYFTYKNNEFKKTQYFDVEYNTDKLGEKSFDEYVNMIYETLKSSVEAHKMGDVEIGSFLSGGVDSSFIASISNPVKTFTVGFNIEGFDESLYAKELSDKLKIQNYKKSVTSDEFFDILPKVQYHSDEPHANLSAVPLYFLSQMTAEHVKAVLTGEGADEFFGGYMTYLDTPFGEAYSKLPFGFRRFIKNITQPLPNFKGKEMLKKYGQKVEDYYIGQAFIMDDGEANDILSDKYKNTMSYKDVTKPYFDKVKGKSDLIKKQYLDLFLWVPSDIFLKADKMSMAHGLETRGPICDREVFKVASRIPKKYLFKGKVTKYIFREMANKVIPDEWANRKKVGFTVPFKLWLKEQKYYDRVKSMFNEDFVSEFFIKDKLLTMLDEHFKGVKNNGRKIYTVYSFLVWYKVFFVEN